MEFIKSFNPLWLLLVVNIYIPFLVSRLAHKNNLRLMQERWLSNFRVEISELLARCEERSQISSLTVRANNLNEVTSEKITKSDVTLLGIKARIRLLFLEDHRSERKRFIELIDKLIDSCQQKETNNSFVFDIERYRISELSLVEQVEFLIESNVARMKKLA